MMNNVEFRVSVKQKTDGSYFDTDTGKKVEYESENEICGKFSDWSMVGDFIEIVMNNFDDVIVNVSIENDKEGE